MKVTILSNSRGGLLSFSTNLATRLVVPSTRECKVKIFFLTQPEKAKRILGPENIHLNYLTTTHFVPNLRTLVDFLFHDRPDILHINFALFWPLAIFKKWVFKIPFILTLHGFPQPWLEPSFVSKIKYILETMSLPIAASQASAIVVVSNFVKKTIKINYSIDSEVIYNGIETNKFVHMEKNRSKEQMGYEEKDCVILFVGKLHPYKDPFTLIKAFNEARKIDKDLRLIIVGGGELYKEVRDKIEELNIQKIVKIFKQLIEDELMLCYAASDIFVLPSINEAFGIVLLEAMASGLAVIASNSGACPEIIHNSGLLFTQGNHLDLAEKIIKLSSNRKLLERLGKAGISRTDKFSWEEAAHKYWTLYQRIKLVHTS